MLRTFSHKLLFVVIYLITLNIYSQITKSCLSLKFNTGITFLSKDAENKSSFSVKNRMSFCPGFTYNLKLPKKSIFEFGFLMYNYGGSIYRNIGGNDFGYGATIHILTGQLIYHKQLNLKSNNFMLGIGALLIKQYYGGYSYKDTFNTMIIQSSPGIKILGNISCKYFIHIKRRVLAIDLIYTKGFFNLLELIGIDNLNHFENHYKNLGSGIHFGISYYFRKHNKDLQ